ncbi:MAG TPA: response regulator [Burkholderiales bacterium]|nr:response regulator [Burkholderiales bacterium]
MNSRPPKSERVTARTRILVVEENQRLLHALLQFLATEPTVDVVGSAGSPREAVIEIAKLQPELVLVDWSLPRPEAEECCRLMRLRAAPPKIAALLDDDHGSYRASAIAAGVDAVMGKGQLSEALLPLLDELFPTRLPGR